MKSGNIIFTRHYSSPCGELLLGSLGDRLCLCDWAEGLHREAVDKRLRKLLRAEMVEGDSCAIAQGKLQLDEYFAGKRREFDVPLLTAGTDFQKRVWAALTEIPYGTTVSYAWLASRTGNRQAVRAVANANGANALSILIPCHRVIGSDGSLTGYG
ncbi:MAG: methylated-DNA--[protein]-cysteine S-methyltransferase, partial [Prevotellaceae bacterium]|nr:methylated-DNA--[protein]-cysteine S-methyltransferase [Prevotellaceae bacterium]